MSTTTTRSSRTTLILAALLCCAAGAVGMGALGRPAAAAAQQPAPAAGVQYAALTLSDLRQSAPEGRGRWEFQDSTGRYHAQAMSQLFGIRANEDNRALVVSAIAAKGWELVSHTDAPAVPVSMSNDGNSAGGALERSEQWWFRKR
ncbi:MAG TPA: hypothetical protein VFF65_07705 [Phycisphaerales bacterium]|nr:hypothetical protein [Phycisphaerales bacterium]